MVPSGHILCISKFDWINKIPFVLSRKKSIICRSWSLCFVLFLCSDCFSQIIWSGFGSAFFFLLLKNKKTHKNHTTYFVLPCDSEHAFAFVTFYAFALSISVRLSKCIAFIGECAIKLWWCVCVCIWMRVGGKCFIQHKNRRSTATTTTMTAMMLTHKTQQHSQPRTTRVNKLWFMYQITIFVLWLTPLF